MTVSTGGERHGRGERAGNVDARKRVTQSQRRQLGRDTDSNSLPKPTHWGQAAASKGVCLQVGKEGAEKYPLHSALGNQIYTPAC